MSMGTARRLRGLLVERPGSLGERSRAKRWERFQQLFPEAAGYRVIDLGGTPTSWLRSPLQPEQVVIVNLSRFPQPEEPWLTVENADVCALPRGLLAQRFDLVFSNSLIEHVGGFARREAFAKAVHQLAPRHWVQTPYRYFPVEPHWVFPAMQFLPVPARAYIARTWPLAHTRATRDSAVRVALSTELVGIAELQHYFPQSEIVRERLGPFIKSLIAVRTAHDGGG